VRRSERTAVEMRVRNAFHGVRLGPGRTLWHATAIARGDWDGSAKDIEQWRAAAVDDDWTRVPEEELRHAGTSHLDPAALRYYLPALMLWLLDHYGDDEWSWADSDDMASSDEDDVLGTVIGTLQWIAPGKGLRDDHYTMFDTLFTDDERAAIAAYVEALPRLVRLRRDDAVFVQRSLRDYWGRFLARDIRLTSD